MFVVLLRRILQPEKQLRDEPLLITLRQNEKRTNYRATDVYR